MLGSNYPSEKFLPTEESESGIRKDKNILSKVSPILRNADITVGNLEGVLSDVRGGAKQCKRNCYTFRMPSRYGKYLKEAGFDFLSLANNHSNDFGREGCRQTMANLCKLGIFYAGLKGGAEFVIVDRGGVRVGFTAFAPNVSTVSILDIAGAKRVVAEVKRRSDIVIVLFHGGGEGKRYEHISRKNEFYLGENRGNVFLFARSVVDAGADIVFGQGPHLSRAVELYKERFISYSGGNFATYGAIGLGGVRGIAPIFKIMVKRDGSFVCGQIIPVVQRKGEFGPGIDSEMRAVQRIRYLSETDFPEGNGLHILEDGEIEKAERFDDNY